MRVIVIINPAAGPRSTRATAGKVELARGVLGAEGVDVAVSVTERPGHAGELACAADRQGVRLIYAWGGDGTVNEVAAAVAHREAALAVVRAGTGNGLARELGIPRDPRAALLCALGAPERRIDLGELAGRFFVNVAGIGLDAAVARAFNALGRSRRPARYIPAAARVAWSHRAASCTVEIDGAAREANVLFAAFANASQYGAGARIAPGARLDDGLLNVIVAGERSRAARLRDGVRLFTGGLARARDVLVTTAREARVTFPGTVVCHVDGEPFTAGPEIRVRVHPAALRIRAPLPR